MVAPEKKQKKISRYSSTKEMNSHRNVPYVLTHAALPVQLLDPMVAPSVCKVRSRWQQGVRIRVALFVAIIDRVDVLSLNSPKESAHASSPLQLFSPMIVPNA
jgi:hypothetical protein